MINGYLLRDAVISGAVSISNKKNDVDELNVYPVPDGDTGTNMSMTMSAAAKELDLLDDNVTVSEVAQAAASAMLRGARGNSGVILSLLFRGFSKGLSGLKSASAEDMANALEFGVQGAYKAVMKPTEGTILTVARLAAEKAKSVYKTTNDIAVLWQEVCTEAQNTLARTPEMLPVLKKAGVVDAGGQGLVIIFTAMLEVFKGGEITKPEYPSVKPEPSGETVKTAVGDADDDITFTYCTEFLVKKKENCKDASVLRAYLETIGNSVVAVDDNDIIKIHVHTDHPGKALEKGLQFGSLINLKIENMREQHENKVREAKLIKEKDFIPAKPEKKFGFVAVAMGKGIEAMFGDLGADIVVSGGQTMNPSTNDILRAIQSVPAETVFVLPNNKNIIMAAEQAINLADRSVCVLQTRTIPQGISAMLAFDESLDFIQNRINMTKAFEKISTGQITFAARDSEYEGYSIKKGEILAFENSKLAFTSKDVSKAAFKLVRKLVKGDTRYVTLIYGADVTDENAEKLQMLLQSKLSDKIDVMLVNGSQPVYYYIISVE